MDYLFQNIGKPKKVGRPKGSKNDKKTKTNSETKTSKKTKSKTDIKSKKGGNFLGSVGELVAPTGWESFASAASLLAIDRAGAALRKFSKKMSGGRHGTTRKQIFDQRMDLLQIKYDAKDKTWKRNGEVVIDVNKYLSLYGHEESTFPSLPIVIDSLSKFFDIPIKYLDGKNFTGNKQKLFYTGQELLKNIYDKMYEDICNKLKKSPNL
jgi:hypothetical protein